MTEGYEKRDVWVRVPVGVGVATALLLVLTWAGSMVLYRGLTRGPEVAPPAPRAPRLEVADPAERQALFERQRRKLNSNGPGRIAIEAAKALILKEGVR